MLSSFDQLSKGHIYTKKNVYFLSIFQEVKYVLKCTFVVQMRDSDTAILVL
jgi:hypothetical protein